MGLQTLHELEGLTAPYAHVVVALGTFDGVHRGHQALVTTAVKLAKEKNGTAVVFTFANHPLSIVDPRRCPPQLGTLQQKERWMQELGVDVLILLPFTKKLLKQSPAEFVELLIQRLQPEAIVVGPNYSFGHRGQGDPEMLRQAGAEHGFAVHIHPEVTEDGEMISSTAIRQCILEGRMEEARLLLGRPFSLEGPVVHGEKRGRLLGFPTANLQLPTLLAVPENGVYAVKVCVEGTYYAGVANVGTNPTFTEVERRLEVFLLQFSGDLYGKSLEVEFLGRLRGEQRFDGAEKLIAQIKLDIENAADFFIKESLSLSATV